MKSAITSWFGDFEKSCCLTDTSVNLQHTGGGVGFNASTVCLDSGSLSSNCSQFRWRHLPACMHTHTHTNMLEEAGKWTLPQFQPMKTSCCISDCFLRLCAKSLGETSTVVFRRLRFNPEVVCVLAYLLRSLPPFSQFFPPFCLFLTQRTNSAGIPRIHVEQENQMTRTARSAENAQKWNIGFQSRGSGIIENKQLCVAVPPQTKY